MNIYKSTLKNVNNNITIFECKYSLYNYIIMLYKW